MRAFNCVRFGLLGAALILVGFAPWATASESAPAQASAYQLQMTISRDKVVISKPLAVLADGVEAVFQSDGAVATSLGYRAVVKVSHSDRLAKGKGELAEVDVKFFEQRDGESVLRGQSSLTLELGKAASLRLPGNAKDAATARTYEFEVQVTKATAGPPSMAARGD